MKMRTRSICLLSLLLASVALTACKQEQKVWELDTAAIETGRIVHEEPVLPNGPDGTWDEGLVDPGSAIYHDGEYHMFYNGLPYWPSLLGVGYATSPDGIEWTRMVDEPVFTVDMAGGLSAENIMADSIVVDGDQWVLYFSISEAPDEYVGSIGRATAESPTGPWTVDPKPVLVPGEGVEWDSMYIGHADVVPVDDGFVMYYSGSGGIGRAESMDGVEWTKYDDPATTNMLYEASDPVIASLDVDDPNVERIGDQWVMIYRSVNTLNLALSEDGIIWEDYAGNPVVDSTMVDGKQIWYSSLVAQEGRLLLYFEAGVVETDVHLAEWPLRESE
jgi:predicted GH43/DUF377 family glycosyl hydrolase